MRYIKAQDLLPEEVVELIQTYIDGEYIYIPRKNGYRKMWGEATNAKAETKFRNASIYKDYKSGIAVKVLAKSYFLSEKSIQRIIVQQKKEEATINFNGS